MEVSFNTCQNDGHQWNFTDLIEKRIRPSEVLLWSSSVEMADKYASIFYNSSIYFDENCFLCQCTKSGTFGKFCEYQLTHESESFEAAIDAQFEQKKSDQWGIQEYGTIICYKTLKMSDCVYGLLCLDWRDICDTNQQCMDGLDEENCDKLEFNECEEDEYRCTNGMCIAEEYWLDGK
ncbi:unnamed protein product [Adineta steineri]|uniref:Uncharacterized protein n=1 Tax=Adineta steineri TaxID=433720 RepID=A0A819PTP6_9BILA|nr:unnamed protein product [Adineta steineri]CAF4019498.1 unnamed protein product [Adineta steineri]